MKKSNLTIVIIDDDPDDTFFMREALGTVNLKVRLVTFLNPVEALRTLTLEKSVLPDVIFMDINMPLKNGFECLRELRKSERFDKSAIVMYSTAMTPGMTRELVALGASHTFVKPIHPDGYQGMVRHVLKGHIE